MFLSLRSCKNFILINSFLLLLGYLEYYFFTYYVSQFFGILIIYTARNYVIMYFIDNGTKNKLQIRNDHSKIPVEDYPFEFHKNVISATAIETVTHMYMSGFFVNYSKIDLIYFIPLSFLFEIIFDFFHYFSHRLLHHKYLYKYFHKKHHKFNHPISITTFYQDPMDLLITNSIPTILSVWIISPILQISHLQFHWIIVYKNFVEISGHSGRISYPTSCFPQCIWIPKLLTIELYTEDHDLHHSVNNCNYSKRFSLWDKVFGTYTSGLKHNL